MAWNLTKIEEPNAITADCLEELRSKGFSIYPINKINVFGDEWFADNLNTIPYVSNRGQIVYVPWKETFDFYNISVVIESEEDDNITSSFLVIPLGYEWNKRMLAIYILPNLKKKPSPQIINISLYKNVEQGEVL